MGAVFVTPVECSPASVGSWQDVDLDTFVGGLGADVTGVILRIENTYASADYAAGVRKNGSTDNRYNVISSTAIFGCMIGVDASHIFECYIGNTTRINIFIVGYTTSGFTFNTNAVDKSTAVEGSWTDVACSANAPGALGLIFERNDTSNDNFAFGIRKNGSSDNRIEGVALHGCWPVIGCDASQICEQYIESNPENQLFLLGYITAGATLLTNATDMSMAGTGAYADLTALPAGALGGIFELQCPSDTYYQGFIRVNGSAEDRYYEHTHDFQIVQCDANRLTEGKIANVALDFFLVGYFVEIVSGTAVPVFINQLRQQGVT